jgi:hypothetical protein
MNPRAPRRATRKAGRKTPKLKLNRETLKDLTAAGKEIKGGLKDVSLAQACSIWPVCHGE